MVEPGDSKLLQGYHAAESTLIRARAGSGKTWMLKQLTYLVTANLFLTTEPGIRLVPQGVEQPRMVG